ncbi:MAG: hypothetical protein ACSHX0_09765 [Akkermansiaceae bacterium]
MALEKVEGISGAYIDSNITLHLAKAGTFDKAKVQAIIAPYKMKIKGAVPLDGVPL